MEPAFTLPERMLPIKTAIKDREYAIDHLPSNKIKDVIISRFVNVLENTWNNVNNIRKHDYNIIKDFKFNHQFLKCNSDVMICRADTVMSQIEYNKEIVRMLMVIHYIKKISKAPTLKMRKELTN